MNIGRLEKLPLRTLWPHEARDFTTWIAENLDFLGETLGMEMSLVEQEAAAGTFSCDVLAEDANGNPVIIENQLERTDHDHLGKLITYLSNLDARTAIWITSAPRPEHERAIRWLNEVVPGNTAFFLLKIEAYRIGGSMPAPMLTIVEGPSVEASMVGTQKKEMAVRHVVRREFWAQLLDRANAKTPLHSGRSPGQDTWLNAGSGKSGIEYQYHIRTDNAQVGLRLRLPTTEETKQLFDALLARKDTIEQAFGGQLEWMRQDDTRMSMIRIFLAGGGWQDRDRWPEIQDRMVDAMVRLEKALRPHIARMK